MAKDAELDRLKAAQDAAFQRKQNAYQAQQSAWDDRSCARDAMNRAYEAKQRAYTEQDRTWQYYQSVRSSNGPRIDSLNSQQESAYQNMRRSYEAASSAYERRDGASASSYAAEGRRYKEESQRYVAERRRLVEEIRSARAQHEASKPAFQRAKDDFNVAKRNFDSTKSRYERAQVEFKQAKADFDAAVKAFKSRLENVKAESQRRREDKKSIAAKAGVPNQYRDNVWVSKDPAGNTNIYFGGVGKPNGPGHGHYVLDRSGNVTYKRDPFDPHGAQNFVRDKALENRLAGIAMDVFHRDRSSTGPRSDQYHDGVVTVKVKSGYNRKTNTIATDVIVIDRATSPDEHFHLILSEQDGSVLFSEWRKNH